MQASKRRKILVNRKRNSIWSSAKKLSDDERQVAIAMRQVVLDIFQNLAKFKHPLAYSGLIASQKDALPPFTVKHCAQSSSR
eukprot:2349179-Ditylum_brightwellii.AAC.1